MRPEDDPSWARYRAAVLEVGTTPTLRIPLTEPVAPAARARLAAHGFGGPFAVLTACNPRGRPIDAAENARRHAALEARVASEGWRALPCDGLDPHEPHREQGMALLLDEAAAVALACALEQSAIYWWDGDRFWLVPALVQGDREALPVP